MLGGLSCTFCFATPVLHQSCEVAVRCMPLFVRRPYGEVVQEILGIIRLMYNEQHVCSRNATCLWMSLGGQELMPACGN